MARVFLNQNYLWLSLAFRFLGFLSAWFSPLAGGPSPSDFLSYRLRNTHLQSPDQQTRKWIWVQPLKTMQSFLPVAVSALPASVPGGLCMACDPTMFSHLLLPVPPCLSSSSLSSTSPLLFLILLLGQSTETALALSIALVFKEFQYYYGISSLLCFIISGGYMFLCEKIPFIRQS